MTTLNPKDRVIGIYPTRKGFGFAVVEARGRLVNWGVAQLYSQNDEEMLVRLEAMVDKYAPQLMCLEDTSNTRRGEKARSRIEQAVGYAGIRDISVLLVSRGELRHTLVLDSAATNHDVAISVSEVFTELEEYLPTKRQPWKSENDRMAVFAAVGLALSGVA